MSLISRRPQIISEVDTNCYFSAAKQFCILACDGQLTAGPINTAALIGTEEQLNCSATVGTGVLAWSIYDETVPSKFKRIYQTPHNDVLTGFTDRYGISRSSDGNEYNLIIKQVNSSIATTYRCELEENSVKLADLVAVGKYNKICAYKIVQCAVFLNCARF
jgi:hypothetical protein